MALTLPRWIAATVAGCLIILASVLSRPAPRPRPQNPRVAFVWAEQRAARTSTDGVNRLQALVLRDSVRAVTARATRVDSSRMLVSGALPPNLQALDRVLGARIALLRSRPAATPIDIVFALDTASMIRGRPVSRTMLTSTHVLPSTSGTRCTAIVRHQPRYDWFGDANRRYRNTYLTSAPVAARVLGPCGFYEAFGVPGPAIDRWLANGGWKFGASAALKGALDVMNFPFYNYRWEPLWGRAAGWPLRRFVTTAGYRCASGDAAACKRLLLEPNSDAEVRRTVRVEGDRIVVSSRDYDDLWFTSLGPEEPRLLADMARSIGPEQFRRFWTSNQPPAEAFLAATGQEIGTWTLAWAREHYGDNGYGPGTDASSMALTGLLALLGLSAAIVASRRRQVA